MSKKGIVGTVFGQQENKPKLITGNDAAAAEAKAADEAARRMRSQERARQGAAASQVVGSGSGQAFAQLQAGRKSLLGG